MTMKKKTKMFTIILTFIILVCAMRIKPFAETHGGFTSLYQYIHTIESHQSYGSSTFSSSTPFYSNINVRTYGTVYVLNGNGSQSFDSGYVTGYYSNSLASAQASVTEGVFVGHCIRTSAAGTSNDVLLSSFSVDTE